MDFVALSAFEDAVCCGLGTHLSGIGQIGTVRAVSKLSAHHGLHAARDISLCLDPLPNDLPLADMAKRLGAMISLQLYLSPEGHLTATEDAVPQHQQHLEQYLQVLGPRVLGLQLNEMSIRVAYEHSDGSSLARRVAVQCLSIRKLDLGSSTCEWDCMQLLEQLEHLTCTQPSSADALCRKTQPTAGQNPNLRSLTLLNDTDVTCEMDLYLVAGLLSVSTIIEILSIQFPYLLITASLLDEDSSVNGPKNAGEAGVGETSKFVALLDQRLCGGLRVLSRTVGKHGAVAPAPGAGVSVLIELQFTSASFGLEEGEELLSQLFLTLPPISFPFIVGLAYVCERLPNINATFLNCTELRLSGCVQGADSLASLQSNERLRCLRLYDLCSLHPHDLRDTLQVLSDKELTKVRITNSVNFGSLVETLRLSSIAPQLCVLCFQSRHPVVDNVECIIRARNKPNLTYEETKGTDLARAQFLVSVTEQGTAAHASALALLREVVDNGFRTNNQKLRQEWLRAVAELRLGAAVAMKVAHKTMVAASHEERAAALKHWEAAVASFHRLHVNIGNVPAGRPLI